MYGPEPVGSTSNHLVKNIRPFLIEQDSSASFVSRGGKLACVLFRYSASGRQNHAGSQATVTESPETPVTNYYTTDRIDVIIQKSEWRDSYSGIGMVRVRKL